MAYIVFGSIARSAPDPVYTSGQLRNRDVSGIHHSDTIDWLKTRLAQIQEQMAQEESPARIARMRSIVANLTAAIARDAARHTR